MTARDSGEHHEANLPRIKPRVLRQEVLEALRSAILNDDFEVVVEDGASEGFEHFLSQDPRFDPGEVGFVVLTGIARGHSAPRGGLSSLVSTIYTLPAGDDSAGPSVAPLWTNNVYCRQ